MKYPNITEDICFFFKSHQRTTTHVVIDLEFHQSEEQAKTRKCQNEFECFSLSVQAGDVEIGGSMGLDCRSNDYFDMKLSENQMFH